ncbi:2,3-diaminopropionate biosynthesis protein SbnB [Frankia sp. AiPs1]
MLVLRESDVTKVLDGAESAVLDLVRVVYAEHAKGLSIIPHSVFLRFPDDPAKRVIGLPAASRGDRPVVGFKWIASFPANIDREIPRASAVVVLNSLDTGRPEAFLSAATISARRTGAGAAVAASVFPPTQTDRLLLVGCGAINLEVLRFCQEVFPDLTEIALHDREQHRGELFKEKARQLWPRLRYRTEPDLAGACREYPLISLATTAGSPYLTTDFSPGTTVLHLSLRDLPVETILASRNVVDDADHVCREQTSLHLAEQHCGHRGFIHDDIGSAVLRGDVSSAPDTVTVVSPFGLGVLDIVLAAYVREHAGDIPRGVQIDDFLF